VRQVAANTNAAEATHALRTSNSCASTRRELTSSKTDGGRKNYFLDELAMLSFSYKEP
jgi:hypothetical protein